MSSLANAAAGTLRYVKPTIEAYQKALASDKVSDAIKFETIRQIEDQYGSMQDFEKMEWIMLYTEYLVPIGPIGIGDKHKKITSQKFEMCYQKFLLEKTCNGVFPFTAFVKL